MNKSLNPGQSQASKTHIRSDQQYTNSNDPTQIKYKKAIREISKLINITKSLKKQINSLQSQLNQSFQQNQMLRDRIQDLESGQRTQNHHHLSPTPEKNAHEKQLQNTGSISQYLDAKKKVDQLEDSLCQKQKIIKQLQEVLQNKHIQNIELYSKCQKLGEQVHKLRQHNSSDKTVKDNEQYPSRQSLEEQIKKSEEYLKILTEECSKLKSERIQHNIFTNIQNVGSTNLHSSGAPSPYTYSVLHHKIASQPFNSTIPPRLMHLSTLKNQTPEQQHNKKRNDSSVNKNKWRQQREKYRKQIKTLKKSNDFYLEKFEKILGFVDRQQQFIEKVIFNGQTSSNIGNSGGLNRNRNYGINFSSSGHQFNGIAQNYSEHDAYRF